MPNHRKDKARSKAPRTLVLLNKVLSGLLRLVRKVEKVTR